MLDFEDGRISQFKNDISGCSQPGVVVTGDWTGEGGDRWCSRAGTGWSVGVSQSQYCSHRRPRNTHSQSVSPVSHG